MADHGKKFTPKQAAKKGGRTEGGPGAPFRTYTVQGSGTRRGRSYTPPWLKKSRGP
jgi:hypothetical protein